MKLKAVLVFFIVFFVSAPSWGWIYFSPREKDTELIEIFEDIELNGPDAEAVSALEDYIESHPLGANTDEALIRLARIRMQRKDYSGAERLYERLLEKYPATRFKYDTLYELGYLRYRAGDLKAAKEMVEQVSTNNLATVALRVKSRLLLKDIGSALVAVGPEVDAPAIGALLPLKGRYAQYGEAALKGVLLAAEVFGSRYGAVTVYARDVETDPDQAERVVAELASDDKVLGLVGPLLSATSQEAAELAQKKRIPLVTLSQKDGVTEAGDYVFRNFITPQQQAATLAEYSTGVMRMKRFAIMYPENRYGVELANLFEKEVEARGGEIVRVAPYKPGTSDFSDQITYIFDIQVEERQEGRRTMREYTPTVEVDAVFIPDTYETVGLAAPYLDYYNVEEVRLLGPNGWNSPELVKRAGANVEGALFVDGFFSGSTRPGTMEFTERFRATYGTEPGVIEAQAYDAARVMIAAINSEIGSVPDRRALKTRIRRVEDFDGACGSLTFDRGGEAVKELFVLMVRDGRIVEAPREWAWPEEGQEEGADGVPAAPGGPDGPDGIDGFEGLDSTEGRGPIELD